MTEREPGAVAITHVNLVPMDREAIVPDQTVVIAGGRILSIAGAAAAIPAGARVLDGSGQYLMPGIADMHVHWWDLDDHRLYLANGVTTVRNMWGAPMHLALQRKIRAGEFPGPHLITTSPIVDGPGRNGRTIWSTSAMVSRPEEAEPLVRAYAERGYPQVKVYSWLSPEGHAALCAAAKKHGLLITGHCPDSLTYEQAIANGHRCFEHLTGILSGHFLPGVQLPDPSDRASRVVLAKLAAESLDLDAVRRLAHQMSAEQIWNCPTAVVWQMMNQGSAQAKSDPNLRFMTPSARAEWDPAQDFRFRGIQFDDAYLETMRRRNEVYLRIIRILHEEGAPLLLGTDTPNPYVIPGFSIHRELVNLRAAGLSAFEALRCGTSEAARFVGETDEWGSIGIGKRADLLLMARNPLDDVAALQDLSHVFVNGYAFPRSALDELLVERARGVEQPPSFTSALEPIAGGPASASPHRAGTLRDVIAGAPGAEISYRHQLTEAGNILVEERTASGQRQAAGQVRTTSLELRPDGTIVRGAQRMTSPVGEELIEIQADRERGSVVRVQGIDGFRSETAFADPLIASERMSVTAFAIAVAATTDERPRAALTAERGEPRSVVAVVKNERAATADGPGIWRVTIDRVSELTEQTYRLAADGALVAVEELSPRGERRISPVER